MSVVKLKDGQVLNIIDFDDALKVIAEKLGTDFRNAVKTECVYENETKEINKLNEELDEQKWENDNLEDDNDELESQIEVLKQEVKEIEKQLATYKLALELACISFVGCNGSGWEKYKYDVLQEAEAKIKEEKNNESRKNG